MSDAQIDARARNSNIQAVAGSIVNQDCEVDFVAEGLLNKVYKVQYGDRSAILRIALPVDPKAKTESEVATLRFVRRYGAIPVPSVMAFDSSRLNAIGLEWMLMEHMPGIPLGEHWKSIPWSGKANIAKQLAFHCAAMHKHRFNAIGNIYPDPEPSSPRSGLPEIKKIVSVPFLYGQGTSERAPRGPFGRSQDWLMAQLLVKEEVATNDMKNAEDDSDREDAENTLKIVKQLKTLLPDFFPTYVAEATVLRHSDLGAHNILVSKEGHLTAVLDWECVSAVPLWKACNLPKIFDRKSKLQMPVESGYGREENGEVDDLYWMDLEAYEKTQMRAIFLETIGDLEPEWLKTYQSSQKHREFASVVEDCDDVLSIRRILHWLKDLETGRHDYNFDVWSTEQPRSQDPEDPEGFYNKVMAQRRLPREELILTEKKTAVEQVLVETEQRLSQAEKALGEAESKLVEAREQVGAVKQRLNAMMQKG